MSLLGGARSFGRARTEARFTETLSAYTVALSTEPDENGEYQETETVVYSGVSGEVRFPTLTVREREQGAQFPAVQDVVVKVAVGATPNVAVGTMWRVTASTSDASLVGRTFRTKGLPQAGNVTAHRYPVEAS
ncbi:DUF6093 family protein [Microbacterium sp. NPDC055455]